MSTAMRVVLGAGVVVVAVVLLIVLKDDGDDSSAGTTTGSTEAATKPAPAAPAEPEIATIEVDESGKPVGGVAELSFDAGEEIRFEVRSAEADEVHIHGYDVEKEVPAGGTVTFSFPADLEGLFEVELHHSEEQIAELRVNP